MSYWYPPAVGAAAERMQAFAKYLPAHGWDVHVLTAGHGVAADPNITVVADPWQRGAGPIADYNPFEQSTWRTRLRGFFREFIFPDRFVRWQRAAYDFGLSIIREWKPDLLLVSFPPASAVQLAHRLQKATRTRLVLDYRDKWLGPGGYAPRFNRTVKKHVLLEYNGLMASAGVTAVSEALIADLVNDAGFPEKRTSVVYNGFEPSPAPANTPSAECAEGWPVIAHVGTVIPRNQPHLFFKSIYSLMAKLLEGDLRADIIRNVRFRFVGNLDRQFLTDTGIDFLFTTSGLVSREAARSEMFNADALLLLTGDYVGQWGYSVKLFEYLQTGRPILCLEESPGSNDARLLRELAPDRCFIGRLGDADSLVEQLTQLREYLRTNPRLSTGAPFTLPPELARFSRANQTAELARFLNTCITK